MQHITTRVRAYKSNAEEPAIGAFSRDAVMAEGSGLRILPSSKCSHCVYDSAESTSLLSCGNEVRTSFEFTVGSFGESASSPHPRCFDLPHRRTVSSSQFTIQSTERGLICLVSCRRLLHVGYVLRSRRISQVLCQIPAGTRGATPAQGDRDIMSCGT